MPPTASSSEVRPTPESGAGRGTLRYRIGLLVLGAALAIAGTDGGDPGETVEAEPRADAQAVARTASSVGTSQGPSIAPLGVAVSPRVTVGPPASWSDTEVLVALRPGADPFELANDHEARVHREPRGSGRVSLTRPAESSRDDFLAALRSDPRVRSARAQGIVRGAAKGGGKPTDGGSGGGKGGKDGGTTASLRALPQQWHLDAISAPLPGDRDLSSLVVAVLDTGVAYEDRVDGTGTYVAAPSLAGSPIVAPLDLVHGDSHAGDDHGHGTHIASLIASQGGVEGVAPGVGLMPIKVLDADNVGFELDLVDGIHHAVASGADVINMSLAFGPYYLPSPALLGAIEAARDAGVVLVAAAGNDGVRHVCWPAASPDVIAVAGSSTDGAGGFLQPGYANRGGMVDVVAPGGDLTADRDGDGYPDGILAETFAPGDPSALGLWFWAGSSQAAAQVSGAAAHMLFEGIAAHQVALTLQKNALNAAGSADRDGFRDGWGGGRLDVTGSLGSGSVPREYRVAILPFVADPGDGTIVPSAKVTLLDGSTVWGMPLAVRFSGSSSGASECSPNFDEPCFVSGPPVPKKLKGKVAPHVWTLSTDYVFAGGVANRPRSAVFASDELEVLLGAVEGSPELDGSLLGFQWDAQVHAELGPLSEGVVVVDSGAGLSTSPLALLLTPEVLFGAAALGDAEATEVPLDLDGAGISTSPLGFSSVTLWSFSGSGISTSPLGSFSLALFGSGISTSPLGFSAWNLYSFTGASSGGDSALTVDLSGEPILMDEGVLVGSDVSGSSIESFLQSGGWIDSEGHTGASLLTASGVTGWAPEAVGLEAAGDGRGTAF